MTAAPTRSLSIRIPIGLADAIEQKARESHSSRVFVVCNALAVAGFPFFPPPDARSQLDRILRKYRQTRPTVAAALGITQAAVGHWATALKKPTPEHVIEMEERLGIPRWEVRPDLWPPPARKRGRKPAASGADPPDTPHQALAASAA